MLYPNTQPSGVVGGSDNKKRLQQLLSNNGAAPLFSSSGRSASVASLPSVGGPALSFNPFLKMLAGHPGETLDSLPTNSPLSGFVGSSVPTTSGSANSGVAAPQSPSGPIGSFQQANPFDNADAGYTPGGHYNDTYAPPGSPMLINTFGNGGGQASMGPSGIGLSSSSPLYHTLLQLAMYGMDS